ncbi:Beta-1,3-galactosyltransferase 5 [Armadillidium nasatum]|uniref:Beta-1,3-galactosyltransferase 5 n=1 Tax=Armadillidium nasatum TaxID=96803 RepID=A0A5N5T417_9CRUS|nr:Beta-1,3-galactosyltransferase 5 [Armadillidium nasatum]
MILRSAGWLLFTIWFLNSFLSRKTKDGTPDYNDEDILKDMKMYFKEFSKENLSKYFFAQFGNNDESFFTEDIEPADYTDLNVNVSLTENEVRFFPPFPTVLKGKPGNDFENLTLKMDSVNRNFCNDSTFIIAVIPSSTTNFQDRDIIRRSWGSSYLFNYSKLSFDSNVDIFYVKYSFFYWVILGPNTSIFYVKYRLFIWINLGPNTSIFYTNYSLYLSGFQYFYILCKILSIFIWPDWVLIPPYSITNYNLYLVSLAPNISIFYIKYSLYLFVYINLVSLGFDTSIFYTNYSLHLVSPGSKNFALFSAFKTRFADLCSSSVKRIFDYFHVQSIKYVNYQFIYPSNMSIINPIYPSNMSIINSSIHQICQLSIQLSIKYVNYQSIKHVNHQFIYPSNMSIIYQSIYPSNMSIINSSIHQICQSSIPLFIKYVNHQFIYPSNMSIINPIIHQICQLSIHQTCQSPIHLSIKYVNYLSMHLSIKYVNYQFIYPSNMSIFNPSIHQICQSPIHLSIKYLKIKNDKWDFRPIFLVGATNDEAIQKELEQEAKNHGDLLQMNFIDSYRNLTYKTMVSLLWISENCKDVPWILKADDDVVVNPFSLRTFLEKELSRNQSPDIIYVT